MNWFAAKLHESRLSATVHRIFEEEKSEIVELMPDDLSDDQWQQVATYLANLNFDIRGGEDAKYLYTRQATRRIDNWPREDHPNGGWCTSNPPWVAAIKIAMGGEEPEELAGPLGSDPDKVVKKIRRAFGLTTDPSEAGFIMADGKMLDFSGKRIGGPAGTRSMDHSEATGYIPGEHDSNWSKYKAFGMGAGAIRCGHGNLDIFKEPTNAQYSTLRRSILPHYLHEYFVNLDLNGNGGRAAQSYDKRVPVQRIINDIKSYYKTGKIPPLPKHLQLERDGSGIFRRVEGGKERYSARCPVTGIIHGDFPDLKSALENRLYKTAFVDKIDRYKKELEKLDKPPKNGKPLKTGLKIKQ